MIIASIASLASRRPLLEQVINSLAPQVDAICVYLNGYDGIPAYLRHPKVVHAILSSEAGWRGAEAKFFPFDRDAFKAAPRWSDDDVAFVCDDDIIYPPDYVEKMMECMARHPGCAVCVHGSVLMDPFISYADSRYIARASGRLSEDAQVHIPGTGTMAFRIGDLPINLDDTFKWSHAVDPQVALLCRNLGLKIWSLPRPGYWLKPMKIAHNITSVFRQRVGGGNDSKETAMLSQVKWPALPHHAEGFVTRDQVNSGAAVKRHDRLIRHYLGDPTPAATSTTPNPNSMMSLEAAEWIRAHARHLGRGSVVELGSGHGTARLVESMPDGLNVVTVEHDSRFVGLVEGARYIHAPLIGAWYDAKVLEEQLPERETIKALLVDGPPKRGRSHVLKHLDLFPKDVPVLVDDVNREEELELLKAFAVRRRSLFSVHHGFDGRAFGTIGWEKQ